MGFLAGLAKTAAGAFLGSAAGSLGSKVVSGSNKPAYSQEDVLEQITLGNQQDISNQKEMFDYRIDQGINAGMTPYEMYMGPAAGAAGGTTGSGQTLGNAATQKSIAQQQIKEQQRMQLAGNATQLMQTKMQTDAQKDVAQIQAGATEYGADLQYQAKMVANAIEQNKLDTVVIPMAAANIGKTEKETERLINEIATSKPEFVLRRLELTMGMDNQLTELMKLHFGISLNDPSSFAKLSEKRRKDIIAFAMAMQSGLAKNIEGAKDQLGLPPGLTEFLGNATGRVEQFFGNSNALGNSKQSVQQRSRRGIGARR